MLDFEIVSKPFSLQLHFNENRIRKSIFFFIKIHYSSLHVMLMVISGNISFLCNVAQYKMLFF